MKKTPPTAFRLPRPSLKSKVIAVVPSLDLDDVEAEYAAKSTDLPRTKKRSGSPWMLGGTLIVLLLASLLCVVAARHEDIQPSASGDPKMLIAALRFANCKAAPGLIESVSGERPLSFEIGGKIRAVFVDEGQTVKAGDRIAELENGDAIARLKSSQTDVLAAEARLGILKGNLESDLKKAESDVARLKAEILLLEPRAEDIEQARAEMQAVEADAKRLAGDEQRYSDPGGRGTSWSLQVYDQARGLAQAAAAKLTSSQARLHALKAGSRPEEKARMRELLAGAEAELMRQRTTSPFQIQAAQSQVEKALAEVDLAKAELEKTRIVAAVDGTVLRKYMNPGEVIDALHPQPVVVVADLTRLRVRAEVDESDFSRISVGQRVQITADAMDDGKCLTGRVEKISPVTGQKRFSTGEARERMDVKIVETVVRFDAPPTQFLKLGLRVTAFFEFEAGKQAVP